MNPRWPHPALTVIRALCLVALGFSMAAALEYYGQGGVFCSQAGDCTRVRYLSGQLGQFLPAIGLMAFTSLYALSLLRGKTFARITAVAAVAGGLIAIYLIYVQSQIGSWCWLCLVVDSSSIAMALAGGWLLARPPTDESKLGPGLITLWWAPLWVAIFAPVIYGATFIDEPIPEAIEELYEDGTVNVVELVDFECPFCRAMHPVLKEAIESSDAEIHLVRLVVPFSFHERARPASHAYFCAKAQDQGEAMADLLFAGGLARSDFLANAEELDLDRAAFESCLDDEATDALVQADLDRFERAGGGGLPAVYIGARSYRGFAPGTGPEGFIEAIGAASQGEGGRVRWWPTAAMLLLVLVSIVVPLRTRREK